jgi:hypothetical protein
MGRSAFLLLSKLLVLAGDPTVVCHGGVSNGGGGIVLKIWISDIYFKNCEYIYYASCNGWALRPSKMEKEKEAAAPASCMSPC